MKIFKTEWLLAAGLVALGTAGIVSSNAGCGSSNNTPDGGTGTAGSGAGATGTGGTGTAGSTGTGGGTVTPRVSYTFDTDSSSDSTMWKLSDFPDAYPSKNLGAYANVDAGLTLATPPAIVWTPDDSAGSATSGSMKISVTYTAFDQYVDPSITLATPVDLSGSHSLLKMKVKLVSGSLGTGGFQFHVSSGLTKPNDYVYVSGTWVNATSLVAGSWITTTIDTSTLSPTDGRVFDNSQIVQIGIQFSTGSAVDGGAPPSGPIVLEIDTVQG
jgi:hypothetical protein